MKVAILGTAPSTCDSAPWLDTDWEIWALLGRGARRAERLFEIHDRSLWTPQDVADIQASTVPVYTRVAHSDLARSVAYPFERVRTSLCPPDAPADIFTSSISYMLALAITEGAQSIAIFGVDMLLSEEYAYQRPACEYLIGLARGIGIPVLLPTASALCRSNGIYGLPAEAGGLARATGITEAVLRARLARYDTAFEAAKGRWEQEYVLMAKLEGVRDEVKALIEYVQHFNKGGVVPGGDA